MNRVGIALSGGWLLIAASCGAPSSTTTTSTPIAATTALVQVTGLTTSFEAGGVVRARATAIVASRIMAPILGVHARPGDRVRQGTALVTLDGRAIAADRARAAAAYTATVESAAAASADVNAVEATVTLAQANFTRIRALHDKRSATDQEFDVAVSTLAAAEAQASGARARLAAASAARDAAKSASDAAEVTSTYAVLTAPFDGVVTERAVDPGSMASPGVPLLVVEDGASFRLEVTVDEARASRIGVGQRADIRIGDDTSAPWQPATIEEVARIDPASHSFVVKLGLVGRAARSGTFGRARFAGETRDALTIPSEAVVRRGQLTFVFVVDADGRARLQPISPGQVSPAAVEVLAGLHAGDRVIVRPPATLADGALVTPTGARP